MIGDDGSIAYQTRSRARLTHTFDGRLMHVINDEMDRILGEAMATYEKAQHDAYQRDTLEKPRNLPKSSSSETEAPSDKPEVKLTPRSDGNKTPKNNTIT